jgi:hypothetical protein
MSVTDSTSATPSGVIPPAPTEPAAQPATMTQADAALVAAELVKLMPAPAAGTVPATTPVPTSPPSPVNLFAKGNIVEYVWDDHYDGRSSRVGIVVDVIADDGTGAKSVVAWFEHVSGPIGDHELTAV